MRENGSELSRVRENYLSEKAEIHQAAFRRFGGEKKKLRDSRFARPT